MRRGHKSAYYAVADGRFVSHDPETGETRLTSCPHEATLFTRWQSATDVVQRLLDARAVHRTGVYHSRTSGQWIVVG